MPASVFPFPPLSLLLSLPKTKDPPHVRKCSPLFQTPNSRKLRKTSCSQPRKSPSEILSNQCSVFLSTLNSPSQSLFFSFSLVLSPSLFSFRKIPSRSPLNNGNLFLPKLSPPCCCLLSLFHPLKSTHPFAKRPPSAVVHSAEQRKRFPLAVVVPSTPKFQLLSPAPLSCFPLSLVA